MLFQLGRGLGIIKVAGNPDDLHGIVGAFLTESYGQIPEIGVGQLVGVGYFARDYVVESIPNIKTVCVYLHLKPAILKRVHNGSQLCARRGLHRAEQRLRLIVLGAWGEVDAPTSP